MDSVRHWILAVMLVIVIGLRFVPGGGEWYARRIYPVVSFVLSHVASVVPFSLEEWVVIAVCVSLIVIPFVLKRRGWRHVCSIEAEIVGWTVVWFYVGWGCNYYRDSFYQRMHCTPVKVEKKAFLSFLNAYTDSINTLYTQTPNLPNVQTLNLLNAQTPKKVLFNWLYSSVGVLGYMGPFFCESQLNGDLLPVQYPFVYAHEQTHLRGISNEAEANFWAYYVCTHSSDRGIRYAGYYGILPNVIRNTRSILTKEEYKQWVKTLSPKVIRQFEKERNYWRSRYSPFVGKVQDFLFNLLLKGNRIPNGIKNYDQVLEMIMSSQEVKSPGNPEKSK